MSRARLHLTTVVLALTFSSALCAAELEVTAAPATLQLGSGRPGVITIRGPADLTALQITTNHGRLGDVKTTGPGQFTVDYLPPEQTFPRVAIIAVSGTSKSQRLSGWVRLPLWGKAEALLRTKPNTSVTVQIGDRTFGPVTVDARGKGAVTVQVPPGVHQGFYGKKALDLGLPRVSLTHLVLDDAARIADGALQLGVRLYAVTEDGTPRTGLQIRARAASGSVTEFSALAPGVYAASWSLTATTPGGVDLSAWPATEPTATATTRLALLPGAPATMTLTLEPKRFISGVRRDARVTARIFDARGNPTGTAPAFSSTTGVVGTSRSAGEGIFVVDLLVADQFGEATTLTVRAVLPNLAPAELTVPLEPGPPATLAVSPTQLALLRDASARAEIRADVLDAQGNRITAPMIAIATEGTVTELPRTHHLEYRPTRSLHDGADTIELQSSGLSSSIPVQLEGSAARVTVAPKAGFLTNLGNANAFNASLELLGWFGQSIGIGIEPGYFFVPHDTSIASVRVHGFPLLAGLAFRARLARSLRLQANALGGVALTRSTVTLTDQQSVSEVTLSPAAQLALSLGVPTGPGSTFAEVGVRWVGDPKGTNLGGSLFSVGISLGYRVDVL